MLLRGQNLAGRRHLLPMTVERFVELPRQPKQRVDCGSASPTP